jgi:hypothetical protein
VPSLFPSCSFGNGHLNSSVRRFHGRNTDNDFNRGNAIGIRKGESVATLRTVVAFEIERLDHSIPNYFALEILDDGI